MNYCGIEKSEVGISSPDMSMGVPNEIDSWFASNPNWYDEYISEEEDTEVTDNRIDSYSGSRNNTITAWQKNKRYRAHLKQKFCSMSPSVNIAELEGVRTAPAIFCGYSPSDYNFNPVSHTFVSQRGDIRVYHGYLMYFGFRCFSISPRNHYTVKAANKRVRQLSDQKNVFSRKQLNAERKRTLAIYHRQHDS